MKAARNKNKIVEQVNCFPVVIFQDLEQHREVIFMIQSRWGSQSSRTFLSPRLRAVSSTKYVPLFSALQASTVAALQFKLGCCWYKLNVIICNKGEGAIYILPNARLFWNRKCDDASWEMSPPYCIQDGK